MKKKYLQFLAEEALAQLCKLQLKNVKVNLICTIMNSEIDFEMTILNKQHDNVTVHFYSFKKPAENHTTLYQTFEALKTDDFNQIKQTLTTLELI